MTPTALWRVLARGFWAASFGASAWLFLWGVLPAGRQTTSTLITPDLSVPGHDGAGWTAALEKASRWRTRDTDVLRLDVRPRGLDPTVSSTEAASDDARDQNLPGYPDADRGAITFEARLDVPGMVVQPSQTISEPVHPAGGAVFFWQLRAHLPGTYHGQLWLHSEAGDGGEAAPIAIMAQPLTFRVESQLGLGGPDARALGGAGLVVTLVSLVRGLARRRRGPNSAPPGSKEAHIARP